MIFEHFPNKTISAWKERRNELAVHVQEAENTGDGVEVASAAIADNLVRCECAVKKLGANLDKFRQVAHGLILNQPSIPAVCGISAFSQNDRRFVVEDVIAAVENVTEEELENPVSLAYAIAHLAGRTEVDDSKKASLRGIVKSREATSLEDVCLIWLVLLCVLGDRRGVAGSASSQGYFDLVRNKRQTSAVLSLIFSKLTANDSLGLLKLQTEAEKNFGTLAESSAPNKWLAISLLNDVLRMHVIERLASATSRFRQISNAETHEWNELSELSEFCFDWVQATEADLREKTLFRPTRQELVTLLLQFLVKLEIPALPLYKCASRCLSKDEILTPTLISTCSESMAAYVHSKHSTTCQSVTELYSLFLRRFCTFAVECDDPEWLSLTSAGAAVFYSKLILQFLPKQLNLAIYATAFVNVALESLPADVREHVEVLRPILDAMRAMGQAQPNGFEDMRDVVTTKLECMCAVCCKLLGRPVDVNVMKKIDIANTTVENEKRHGLMSALEKPALPEIVVNRSILDLAQGEAPATSPTSNEVAASPALTTRFSFDNLLGGAAGSRGETAVAAFVGKWTAWGRKAA